MDKYSRDAGKPGDIVIASTDAPKKSIVIPEDVMDRFIPELVQTQLNTPLPRLQGHTLFEILPDLRKNFRINDRLSNQWVAAIKAGVGPEQIPFDVSSVKITNVYGAGQPAFFKLVADGMDPMKANDAVMGFSDYFGNKYVDYNPHGTTTFFDRLQLAPRQTMAQVPEMIGKRIGNGMRRYDDVANRFSNKAISIAGGGLAYQVQDLLGMHDLQQDLLNNK
jgi:hypothetical protein